MKFRARRNLRSLISKLISVNNGMNLRKYNIHLEQMNGVVYVDNNNKGRIVYPHESYTYTTQYPKQLTSDTLKCKLNPTIQ